MSREIRRVPADWVHPYDIVTRHTRPLGYGERRTTAELRPLLAMSWREQFEKWEAARLGWEGSEEATKRWTEEAIASLRKSDPSGRRPESWYPKVGDLYYASFEACHGERPNPVDYMPDWPEEARTHWQVYETVSEGTPVSPVFASIDDLIEWLIREAGYSREGAEAFARDGWAPTGLTTGDGQYHRDIEALAALPPDPDA